jgi:hypothetical protein
MFPSSFHISLLSIDQFKHNPIREEKNKRIRRSSLPVRRWRAQAETWARRTTFTNRPPHDLHRSRQKREPGAKAARIRARKITAAAAIRASCSCLMLGRPSKPSGAAHISGSTVGWEWAARCTATAEISHFGRLQRILFPNLTAGDDQEERDDGDGAQLRRALRAPTPRRRRRGRLSTR